MTILSSEILNAHGPYIRFADIPNWSGVDKYDCPDTSVYESSVFFCLADRILEVLCYITSSYSPFELYETTCIKDRHEIFRMSSDLLFWAIQILRSHDSSFRQYLEVYGGTALEQGINAENLRVDLVETIFFLSQNFNRIAATNSTLIIEGV